MTKQVDCQLFISQNLQSLNFFEHDLGLAAAINDDTIAKNNIQVDENEAAVILNFLYHVAKTYK